MSNQQEIAIVDDVRAARSTEAFLERAGYRVWIFESGDAFLSGQLGDDWACVVLDLHAPGIDGISILRALGSRQSAPPVLVLTGRGAIAEAVEAMKLGAVDFLEKPYPAGAFLEAVEGAVASGSMRKTGAIDPEAAARISALPHRQSQVLRGLLKGQPNKVMAYELGLSIRTVEAYRAQLLDRLGVRGTAAAVRLAIAAGMLETI
jgi:two-component system response regulator FixJ